MNYVALKAGKFAGKDFKIGDTIPDELIQPGMVKALIQMGRIGYAGDVPQPVTMAEPAEKVCITVHASEGDLELCATAAGLQSVFDVLTGTAEDAKAVIPTMDDNDALILLHMADSRKTVKDLAEARAKELNAGAGEQ